MLKILIITVLLILLFRMLRRYIFFKAHEGFQKAAEDFMKRQQPPPKPKGSVTVQDPEAKKSSGRQTGGEYVDYEEIP